jgi:uncharacterized delta-60 repeat protein
MKKSGLLLSIPWLGHAVCAQMALDPAFGAGGMVVTSFGPRLEMAYNLVLQADGKIIAVGNFDPLIGVYDSDLLLVRYHTDGTVDSTFGTNGLTLVDVNGDEHAFDAMIQADGSIVVAGTSFNTPGTDKLVMRFTPNGVLDPSFGNGGVVFIDDSFQFEHLRAMALQADEKIVVAGGGFDGAFATVYLARLNTDGSLDSTFSDDGKLELLFDTVQCSALDVALQSDGRIVCAGAGQVPGNSYDPGVVRCLADGTLDSTFSDDGKVTIPWSHGIDDVRAVMIQVDGKILVAGADSNASQASTIAVSRLLPDGSLDASFGQNGTKLVRTGVGNDTRASAMAIDVNGKILLAGTYRSSETEFKSYLCRLEEDGSFDATFGINGELIHSTPGMKEIILGMALQPDGAIVLAGLGGEYSTGNVLLMRYADTSVGVMDPSAPRVPVRADANGIVLMSSSSGTATYQVADVMGRIVAQGSTMVAKEEERRINFRSVLLKGTYVVNLTINGRTIATPFVAVGY